MSSSTSTQYAAALIDQMRESIIAEGYSPPLIGTGFLPAGTQHASTAAFEAEYGYLYDFTNSYGAFWYPDDERGSIRDPPVTQSELAVNQATIRSRHATSPAQGPHVLSCDAEPLYPCKRLVWLLLRRAGRPVRTSMAP